MKSTPQSSSIGLSPRDEKRPTVRGPPRKER